MCTRSYWRLTALDQFDSRYNRRYEAAIQFFRQNTWNDYRTISNQLTWTELYFAVAGYEYAGEPYVLKVPEAAWRRTAGLLVDQAGGKGRARGDAVISVTFLQITPQAFATSLLAETGRTTMLFEDRYKRFIRSGDTSHTSLRGDLFYTGEAFERTMDLLATVEDRSTRSLRVLLDVDPMALM